MAQPADNLNALKKLALIQAELFVPKGQKNDFGKYNYRSCEDILVQVKPLCAKNNCVLLMDSIISRVGERNNVKAWSTLYDLDTGESVNASASAEIEENKKGMDAAQQAGAALSYARKYALAGLFCIDNEKDPDATNKHDKDGRDTAVNPETGEEEKTVSAQQIDAVDHELERTGISRAKILDYVKKDKIELMTQADYIKVMKKLNKTPNKE